MTRVASVDTRPCLAFVCTASHSLAPLLVMLHPMTRAASVDTGTRPSYSRGPGSRRCRGCHLIRRSTSQDSAACGRYSQNLGVSVSRRHQQWIKMSWVQSVWLAGPRSRPPSLHTCIHAHTFACWLMPHTGRSALLPVGVAAGPRNRHPVRKLDDGEFIHSF